METLDLIREPIRSDMVAYNDLFEKALHGPDGLLSDALAHIRGRKGKQLRPMLILLIAKCFGEVNRVTLNAAVGLELLHTASLVHDDVIDESSVRRGQASINALYNNKVAVLVGDWLLSTALLHITRTQNNAIITYLAELGRTLASGEILQLSNTHETKISEEVYYDVIKQKTAALFEACCTMGALSASAADNDVEKAKDFGRNVGIIFQIRDDVFDYFDSPVIGKPTGNDMAEGKLTLPVIYALNKNKDDRMLAIAYKVKRMEAGRDEIDALVDFAKKCGGIDYAQKSMKQLRTKCAHFIDENVHDDCLKNALTTFLDFIINREN